MKPDDATIRSIVELRRHLCARPSGLGLSARAERWLALVDGELDAGEAEALRGTSKAAPRALRRGRGRPQFRLAMGAAEPAGATSGADTDAAASGWAAGVAALVAAAAAPG